MTGAQVGQVCSISKDRSEQQWQRVTIAAGVSHRERLFGADYLGLAADQDL